MLKRHMSTTRRDFFDILGVLLPGMVGRRGNLQFGGITAGIDLALALVEEDPGREVAEDCQISCVMFPSTSRRSSPVQSHALPPGGHLERFTRIAGLDARASRPDVLN